MLFVLLPLIILTGLAMSPGMDAGLPLARRAFGGRQTARTIHFVGMVLLVGFFVVHIADGAAAGPLNELRSMITGWYRTDADGADALGRGGVTMTQFTLNRRRLLTAAALGASGFALSGCDAVRLARLGRSACATSSKAPTT